MSVPHWRRSPTPGRLTCDAVVIGAGICGVSAALAFQKRGLDVRVVERHTLASGASSRNAGFLMRGAADHYADAVKQYGRATAKTLWRWTEDNLTGLRTEGIECLDSYRAVPSCLLALSDDQAAELRAAQILMVEDGFDAPWLDYGDDTAWRTAKSTIRGGLLNPHDAAVNPFELMRHLAARLKHPIIQNHEVDALRTEGQSIRVVTPDLDLLAPRVLVCTNAYAGLLLPDLERLITPRRGQMIAVRRAPASSAGPLRLDCSYYANHGSEYFRQPVRPDGIVVIGGCRTYHADRETGYEDRTTPWVQDEIEKFALKVLGPDLEILQRWAGTMGFTPDGLPLVGPVPAFDSRVWFCGGFTGHGMSMAHKTAHAAVEEMLGGPNTPFPLSRALAGATDDARQRSN